MRPSGTSKVPSASMLASRPSSSLKRLTRGSQMSVSGSAWLTFRGSLNAFARNFPAVGSSGLAGGFQVDEVLGLLLPGSHELLDVALVVDGLLQ